MQIKNLKLSIFNAFLGHIGEGVRAIAFDNTDSTIIIYAYFNRNPGEDDYEIIDMAVTEILANNPQFQNQKIVMSENHSPIGNLNAYKGWIFIRFEQ